MLEQGYMSGMIINNLDWVVGHTEIIQYFIMREVPDLTPVIASYLFTDGSS